MARFEDLTLPHRLFMLAYRYRKVDWAPGAALAAPLAKAKVALISTAGLHTPQQPPFDNAQRGGDCSFREIPNAVDVTTLRIAHRSSAFDQTGALEDRNLVFPLDRLREMQARGEIGELNHRHLSWMGSISAPGRLMREAAPQAAAMLRQDDVKAALLVPA
jgi:D-proline reductase (dithiol) PrdB